MEFKSTASEEIKALGRQQLAQQQSMWIKSSKVRNPQTCPWSNP